MPDQIDTTIYQGLAEAMGVPKVEDGEKGKGSDTHIYTRNEPTEGLGWVAYKRAHFTEARAGCEGSNCIPLDVHKSKGGH